MIVTNVLMGFQNPDDPTRAVTEIDRILSQPSAQWSLDDRIVVRWALQDYKNMMQAADKRIKVLQHDYTEENNVIHIEFGGENVKCA